MRSECWNFQQGQACAGMVPTMLVDNCKLKPENHARVSVEFRQVETLPFNNWRSNTEGKTTCVFTSTNLQNWECFYDHNNMYVTTNLSAYLYSSEDQASRIEQIELEINNHL